MSVKQKFAVAVAVLGFQFISTLPLVPAVYAQQLAESSTAKVEATIGKKAPDFTLTDSNGKSQSLSNYAGKFVVLEWVNFGCPFVKKHYESNNMQHLQDTYSKKGVIWLTICSSGSGKQGNFQASEINSMIKEKNAHPTAYLIDETGKVGREYGAKSTPHMFIVDNKGILIYKGAIDDKPSFDQGDIAGAKNYVKSALDEALAGHKVTTDTTRAYGCSVKYQQ